VMLHLPGTKTLVVPPPVLLPEPEEQADIRTVRVSASAAKKERRMSASGGTGP
jgi:hypothetical protein